MSTQTQTHSTADTIGLFDEYATLERSEEGEHIVLSITAKSPARERRVAGELGNYALGLTIRRRGGAS